MTVLDKHYNPIGNLRNFEKSRAVMPWLFFYLEDKRYDATK
jgi:hypothetical protein